MKHSVKRVAAIHDLSGFGRASLTAIIPILSSMECRSVHCRQRSFPIILGDLIPLVCRLYRSYARLYRSLERAKYRFLTVFILDS